MVMRGRRCRSQIKKQKLAKAKEWQLAGLMLQNRPAASASGFWEVGSGAGAVYSAI
jgi:hypothetical protein